MTPKHSQEPWRVLPRRSSADLYIAANLGWIVARLEDVDGRSMGEQEANAVLISEAPNLLKACKALVALRRGVSDSEVASVIDDAIQTISDAEGTFASAVQRGTPRGER